MAPVDRIGVLLDPLKQPLGLFLSHLVGLGLLGRLRLLFLRGFLGGTLFRLLVGILLLVFGSRGFFFLPFLMGSRGSHGRYRGAGFGGGGFGGGGGFSGGGGGFGGGGASGGW